MGLRVNTGKRYFVLSLVFLFFTFAQAAHFHTSGLSGNHQALTSVSSYGHFANGCVFCSHGTNFKFVSAENISDLNFDISISLPNPLEKLVLTGFKSNNSGRSPPSFV